MIGSRGQEEAPFSLLLAVAMMAMVIPIAAFMFEGFQAWECEQRLSNNLESFGRELELAATLGGGSRITSIDLGLYACPKVIVQNFTIRNPGQAKCMTECHDPNCRLIEATYEDINPDTGESQGLAMAVPPVCVRIPVNVEFKTSGCSEYGYDDLGTAGEGNLEPGYYVLAFIKEGYTVYLCSVPEGEFRR